uniref:Uncharacterized protein n=1 Tax=Lepeophtheirus salmonis TaxID=72036 RepID=A0A0K2UWI0_LEPSM
MTGNSTTFSLLLNSCRNE